MSKEDSQRRACFCDEMVGRLAARNLPEKWIFRGTQEGASVGPSVSRALAACALARSLRRYVRKRVYQRRRIARDAQSLLLSEIYPH
jgi:hypothetical protein